MNNEASINRDAIIKLVCNRSFEKTPPKFREHRTPGSFTVWAEKFADAFISKNAEWLREVLGYGRGSNDGSKQAFFELIGQNQPTNSAAIRAVVDAWAGITPEQRAKTNADKEAARKAEQDTNYLNNLRRTLNNALWQDGPGTQPVGAADLIDGKIAVGFNILSPYKAGAVKRYMLTNSEGRGYKLTGNAVEYARIKLS